MFFRREHLKVAETQEIGFRLESLIGDVADYEIWLGQIPGIYKTAERDATGQFVLVEPREVVERGAN